LIKNTVKTVKLLIKLNVLICAQKMYYYDHKNACAA